MSKHFSSDYKKQCQDNGYYSFNAQSCFHKCHNGFKPIDSFFPKKENIKIKEMKSNCLSTCSSIRNKISNVFDSIDDFVKSDDAKSKLCNTDYRGVNNRNRAPKDDVRSISGDVDEIINSTSDK
ncbi:hypothetical protein OAT67_02595 [Bacteriovoracaceae bacterium]|nr:hypothetical protein [Bacteriovoracaceae bacterium]